MTERTLRDQIAAMIIQQCADQDDVVYNMAIGDVLRILDTHTAAQPAPDAVAEARPNRCYPEHYASGWQCASCGASWKEDGPDECPLEPLT